MMDAQNTIFQTTLLNNVHSVILSVRTVQVRQNYNVWAVHKIYIILNTNAWLPVKKIITIILIKEFVINAISDVKPALDLRTMNAFYATTIFFYSILQTVSTNVHLDILKHLPTTIQYVPYATLIVVSASIKINVFNATLIC